MDNLATILNAIAAEGSSVMLLISAFSYFMGVLFFGLGVYYMTAGPKAWTSIGVTGNAWWITLAVACALMALPETLAVVGRSMFGSIQETSPFSYAEYLRGSGLQPGSCRMGWVNPLLKIYGVISVIRGLFVLRAVGTYGRANSGASPGKGVILIAAGITLFHLLFFVTWINAKTGLKLGSSLC